MAYDLERFVLAQKRNYETAYEEIKSGRKTSHWIWYIFPQIAGLGHSSMSKKYAIADIEEAKAYMQNYFLRNNLIKICQALLECNDKIENIMPYPDDFKLCSCMTLFEIAAPDVKEFALVLKKFFNDERDEKTLYVLGLPWER